MPDSGVTVEFRPGERFRLLRQIGAGGMGTVYEAWDNVRNTRVALKTLTGLNPVALQLFKNEFRALADVSHPNLASLYELYCEDQWYFSMEYIEGGHFLDYVRDGRAATPENYRANSDNDLTQPPGGHSGSRPSPSPAPTIPSIRCDHTRLTKTVTQLAEAIWSLHAAGILHRDLKPLNVKVTPEGRVVVLDFGLATQTTPSFGEGPAITGLVGTVQYMSPEQASGDPITEATDWYAIGVMIFEALTGRRPFEGDPGIVLRNKRIFDAPRITTLVDAPEEWDAICAGLLARSPGSRLSGPDIIARLNPDAVPAAASGRQADRIFVGRELQLAVLREALAESTQSRPSVVFVRGLSGMGKSTLIEKFLGEIANKRNVVILAGRCYEKESLPYKAFDSVIDSLARYLADVLPEDAAELTPRDAAALARVFPVLRQIESFAKAPARTAQSIDQLELRRQAFGALRELLAKLGDRRRVVVYIDDLQWGDTDSALVFREILRPPDAPALLYIASYRSEYEGRSPALDAMLSGVQDVPGFCPHHVLIGPLTPDEGRTLAGRLVVGQSELVAGAVHRFEELARESEGSPYLLQEIASVLSGGMGSLLRGEISLDSVLFRRIETLSPESRRLLESISVSIRPLAEREAFLAAKVATRDPRVLTELRAGHLIREAGGEIEPYHDRVRQTILAHLEAGDLHDYHLRLANGVEASAGPDGTVDAEAAAIHFESGGNATKAGRYYALAAETSSTALAFRHAAALWQKALELSTATGEARRALLIKLADSLANAGRGADAARAYREAGIGMTGPEAFRLERLEAFWFASSGHLDEGRAALERMLGRSGFTLPGPLAQFAGVLFTELRLRFRGTDFVHRSPDQINPADLDRIDSLWAAGRAMAMIDVPTGVFANAKALLLSLAAGDPNRVTRSLIFRNISLAAFRLPGGNNLPRLTAVCKDMVAEANDQYLSGFHQFSEGMIGFVSGRWRDSRSHFREADRTLSAGCTGVAWELSTARVFTLWTLLYSGDLRELCKRAPVYYQEGLERGDLFQAVSIGAGSLPVCELIADRPDAAMKSIDHALSLWTRRNYNLQRAVAIFIRTWVHLYRGESAEALELNRRELAESSRNHFRRVSGTRQWLRFAMAQSALAVAVTSSDRPALLKTAKREAALLESDDNRFGAPLADLIRSGIAALRYDKAVAAVHLQRAARTFAELDMGIFAAVARRRLGQMTDGEPGLALIREADDFMRAEGVVNPARLTDAFSSSYPLV